MGKGCLAFVICFLLMLFDVSIRPLPEIVFWGSVAYVFGFYIFVVCVMLMEHISEKRYNN